MEEVILVNTKDVEVGVLEKIQAHQEAKLHRAISVLVFNSDGEMLLQKRAEDKYHSGGLWTNACCSHPKPGESSATAAKRRLNEEIGIDATPEFLYKFIYKVDLDNGLTEYEYDHVFSCTTNKKPVLDTAEAQDFKYMSMASLKKDIDKNPNDYTFWFKIIVAQLNNRLQPIS